MSFDWKGGKKTSFLFLKNYGGEGGERG